jgi:hypothetical protein
MFPEESIEKVFRIFVNKLLEKDKCEEGPQTADGRPRQDRLSSLSGRQTVNEWENESTNSDGGRQTAAGQAFRPVGKADRQRMGKRINECRLRTTKWTMSDGRLQCRLSSLSGKQTVNGMENES